MNFQLRKWMSIGIEAHLYFMRDMYNNTMGTALRPFARFYMANRANWRLYLSSGGGLIYCIDPFPAPTFNDGRIGTRLNGTTRYDLSTEIRFSPRTFFTAGICHLHISNGNTKRVDRNPSHDSNGFIFGISHMLWPHHQHITH
ncbi:hypothetical protein GCM10023093_24790 [Nemorincola caseinilytica]|uniref:Uncharacterized protein n=1 Tax=Nemorincola caseinilytica TaxID=2054315 RepID=A0ABP8NIQ5_9BACT